MSKKDAGGALGGLGGLASIMATIGTGGLAAPLIATAAPAIAGMTGMMGGGGGAAPLEPHKFDSDNYQMTVPKSTPSLGVGEQFGVNTVQPPQTPNLGNISNNLGMKSDSGMGVNNAKNAEMLSKLNKGFGLASGAMSLGTGIADMIIPEQLPAPPMYQGDAWSLQNRSMVQPWFS